MEELRGVLYGPRVMDSQMGTCLDNLFRPRPPFRYEASIRSRG